MLTAASLFIVSAAAGIALLWMFSKFSNQRAIKATKKRLQARLLELRLYADDPRVVLRAQKELLSENLKYFVLMLRPAFIVTVPMVLLLIVMDGFYGRRPFHPGETAVFTAKTSSLSPSSAAELAVPEGVEVESPGIKAISERQVSWRIRAANATEGAIRVSVDGAQVEKSFAAESGSLYLVNRRVASLASWLLYPGELPLGGGRFEWVEVRYPPADVSYFGLRSHWLVWFVVFSMGIALLFKGRFGVTI